MNAVGASLVWSGVQVTLLVLAGGVVYGVLRRRSPAAGSLAALALLVIAIGFSMLALSPWPNWWRLHVTSTGAAEQTVADARSADSPPDPSVETNTGSAPSAAASRSAAAPADSFDAAAWARTFWKNVVDGFNEPNRTDAATGWRWPSFAAWLLIVGVGLGLARLTIGLVAVERYRRRTNPVNDEPLLALLDATCQRLDCVRRIELRESAEIISPATVGWRRPLILLPLEWREWSEAERRAVLAHEVAHVARGDFAGWLVAQLSVALYFYNPLVHWLARRLRLEQELAADACGALAAGGSAAYLTTLAGMALRQDNRKTNWGARPFLPARGTLLRRIEMLRDRKPISTFTFSTPKRIAVWSTLAALGLVIAGLRGPGATTLLAAPGDGELGVQGAADAKPIDLDYVPADAALVVAVRPGDVMKSDAGKLVLMATGLELKKHEQELGLPISEIDYAKVIISDFPHPGSGRDPAPRIVVRALKAHDWSKFAATIVPDPVAVDSTIAALTGKKYFKPHNAPQQGSSRSHAGTLCYFLPDDRTVIFAPEQEISLVIAASLKPEEQPKWAKSWQRAAIGNIAVMLDVEKLRKLIEPDLKRGSGGPDTAVIAMMGPLWQDSQQLFVGTDIVDKQVGLLALDNCPSEEAAVRVEHTVQALLTFALNGLAEARKVEVDGPADMIVMKKMLVGAAEELLKQANVSHEGSTVVVKSHGEGATFLAVAGIALPAIQKTRESAGRMQSMNNMKQIALAMFNYMDAHGHFPPAVVMGPDGKTPHSWRVELLPYLEQKNIYDQYKMDEPWDSPANKKLSQVTIATFVSPGGSEGHSGEIDYFVLTGPKTMFSGKDGMKIADITGGTSNTIMLVEAKREIPWTKPEDIDYDPAKPLPKLGGHFPGGFIAAFADGSVRWISDQTPADVIHALLDPAGDKTSADLDNRRKAATKPADPANGH